MTTRPLPSPENQAQPERWSTNEGSITVNRRGPNLAHITYEGYLGDTLVEKITTMADSVIADMKPLTLFADLRGITGYSPRMRVTVTKWTWANRHAYRSYNVLVAPGMIATTMAAISLRLGGFVSIWTNAAAFEAALQRAYETSR